MMVQQPQTYNHGKYDYNGKGLYFWFNDDYDKMSYKYILWITHTWMYQLNTLDILR